MINDEEKEIVDEVKEEVSEEIPEKESDDNEQSEETAPEQAENKIAEELAAVKDQLLRTMAEYDNFRKRSAREKDALRVDIIANVMTKFLPILDNLQRALDAECTDENYKKGVEMIDDSFLETLKSLGVEEIESDGVPFDPTMHQAVHRMKSDEAESGTVLQTFAKGYKIGDKVIRFAMVAVAE
ncbi:MAG: nucleotide exchange factor GrpE [Oscillospiraceae bacterium]